MTDPLTPVAVGTAAAPVKSAIEALFGPTLERVKRWSSDKDLQRQISSKNLNSVFARYLDRALNSFSYIQSVTFPQQNLPLLTIYEPLSLAWANFNALSTSRKRPDEMQDVLKSESNIIVIDSAGMGKSTYSKYICIRVCADTEMIPILVNLRSYTGKINIIEMARKEVSEIHKDFPSDVFLYLTTNGKFFFAFDGFDEVSPELQQKCREEIEALAPKLGKSKIFLTSRPQDNLPVLTNSVGFRIEPLKRQQAEAIALRYDKFANLDVGQRLINEFDRVPDRFLQVPLLVALLYKTFGYNNSIATRIATFYGDTFDALYKGHDLTKTGFVRDKQSKLDLLDFRRMLASFCFMSFVKSKPSFGSDVEGALVVKEAQRLVPFTIENPEAFWRDLHAAVPFLVKEGVESKFVHRTIMEFFAAEFIANSERGDRLISSLRLCSALKLRHLDPVIRHGRARHEGQGISGACCSVG